MPTIRPIAQLGHPVLRTPTSAVQSAAAGFVQELADDMIATLRDANGVGLAAPQVFESISLMIVASRPTPRYPAAPAMDPEVMLNPIIIERSADLCAGWEGCLSIPGVRGLVPRSTRIRVRYANLQGEQINREFTDFVARVIQHEEDHLRGLVFLDRLASPQDLVTEQEYQDRFAAAPTPAVATGLGYQIRSA